MPDDLVARVEIAADITAQTQPELVTAALEKYLDDVEKDTSFKLAAVERYLNDELNTDTLLALLGRQDAEAVQTAVSLIDEGRALGRELADV